MSFPFTSPNHPLSFVWQWTHPLNRNHVESPLKETGHVNSVSSETLPSWSGSPVVLWDDRAVPNMLPAFGWPYACPPRRQRRIRQGCGSMDPYCESEWFSLRNHQGTIHKFYWKIDILMNIVSKFYVSSQFWISHMWQIRANSRRFWGERDAGMAMNYNTTTRIWTQTFPLTTFHAAF